jgi:hypothetical protein
LPYTFAGRFYMMYQILAAILIAYGLFLLLSGIAKFNFMIKFAKLKLGKNTSDESAIGFLYLGGGLLLVGGIAVLIFLSGVF